MAATTAPARTKASRNEIRKINAAYNNGVAVGMTIAGYWVTAVAFTLGSYEITHKLRDGGWSSLDRRDTFAIVSTVVVAAFSLWSARNFRYRANRNLWEYEE